MGKHHEVSQVTLADGIEALIHRIEPTRKSGLVIIRSEVPVLLDGLYAMLDEARHLQAIADAAQWNAKARRDAIRAESLALEEAIADSSNGRPPAHGVRSPRWRRRCRMSTIVAFKPGSEGDLGKLTDMLTSPDESVRVLGRAFASGIGEKLEAWLHSEHGRGTDGVVLLEVVATLSLQHIASVAGSVLKPSGDPAITELLTKLIELKLPLYLAAVRAANGGAK